MEKTFLVDYVPIRAYVNKEEWYNEQNIINMLASIQDYLIIIDEIVKINESKNDREFYEKWRDSNNINDQLNAELEKLADNMAVKIETLKNVVAQQTFEVLKNGINNAVDFDKEFITKNKSIVEKLNDNTKKKEKMANANNKQLPN